MLSTLQCDSVVPPYNWKQPVLVVTPMGSNYDQYGERAFNQADRFNLIEGMERRKLPKMILKLSEAQGYNDDSLGVSRTQRAMSKMTPDSLSNATGITSLRRQTFNLDQYPM